MSLSRRGFVRTLGAGTAGVLTGSLGLGRAVPVSAQPSTKTQAPLLHEEIIRLSLNENNRGPGGSANLAIYQAVNPLLGRGYPPEYTNQLMDTLAEVYGVTPANVIIGTGSGPILAGASHAFTGPGKHLATAAPTYTQTEGAARAKGAEVRAVPVRTENLELDLDAMADAAVGAGLVFFCNPNNPTGTAHRYGLVEQWVREVKRRSPETNILIDEAYIDYAFDPEVRTALPLAMELPGVFVTRTFSKAHGMAGLRVGYAIGQEDTVQAIPQAWHLGSINALSAAAAMASIKDRAHLAAEVAENASLRAFTLAAFREMGCETPDSHANCIFPNIGRPASWFRDECMKHNVQVGRDFPPYENTHARVGIGTRPEMERAVEVFRVVLRGN